MSKDVHFAGVLAFPHANLRLVSSNLTVPTIFFAGPLMALTETEVRPTRFRPT